MIIERYICRELALTTVAVTSVLFLIFVSSWFARLLSQVATGGTPVELIFQLLSLKSIDALMILLPLAFYLSVLLAFGRLYKDSEMTAMLACGVSMSRILKLVFWVGAGFALLVSSVSFYFGPWAKAERYVLQEQMKSSSGLEAIAAGQFRELNEGRVVFYAERLSEDGASMENVFIQSSGKDGLNLFSANRAYKYRDPAGKGSFLVLVDGYRYDGVPGSAEFRIVEYREHAVRVEQAAPGVFEIDQNAAKDTLTLWQDGSSGAMAELHWRLSMPVSALLMSMLALFLSRTNPRQGRYGKFFVGILVYVIYSNLLGVGRVWVEKGDVSSMVGMWWVHALLLVGVLFLWFQHGGGMRAWRARRDLRAVT